MNLFDKIKSAVCRIRETEDTEPFENALTIGETSAADFENGTFLNSLDELSETDIELNTAAKEAAKLSITELLRRVIYYGCFAVFLVSCLLLVQNLIAKQRGAEIYDRLEAEFFSTGFSMNLSDAFRPDEGVVKYLASDTESTTLNDMTSIKSGMAAENAGEAKPAAEEEEKKHNEELEKMRAGLMSLAQINPDVYGWITVSGAVVDISFFTTMQNWISLPRE